MQLEYNGIGTPLDWNTMKLGPKWERKTMGQGHNATRIQRDWNTAGLEHDETGTKWERETMGRGHNETGTQT